MALLGKMVTAEVTVPLAAAFWSQHIALVAEEDGRAFCISSIWTSRRGVTTHVIVIQCGQVLHLVHWMVLDSCASMIHNKRERVLEKISSNYYSLTYYFSTSFYLFNLVLCKALPSVNHFSEIICLSLYLIGDMPTLMWMWFLGMVIINNLLLTYC